LAQRSFTSVIDLTHTLTPEFPTFFGIRASQLRGATRSRRTART
jgi:kynurenine formamidase